MTTELPARSRALAVGRALPRGSMTTDAADGAFPQGAEKEHRHG
ncbi:hypothetical protein AB0I54_23345 [Streptomyces sp. NPDC050625]